MSILFRLIFTVAGFAIGMVVMYAIKRPALERLKNAESLVKNQKANIEDMQHNIELLKFNLRKSTEINDSVPEDCKVGPWCEGCIFVRGYSTIVLGNVVNKTYCGKAETCSNFIQNMEVKNYD